MTTERLPTVQEIRDRIDGLPTTHGSSIVYQNAFRYLYLTAGRVSEITGPLAPKGTHATRVNIRGDDAVIFAVKTARRRGRIRPIALPMNPLFERWTAPLFNWFQAHEDSEPFGSLVGRSYQRMSRIVFEGLKWPVEDYHKAVYSEAEDSKIIFERSRDGIREYLVEYPSLERKWVTDPKIQVGTVVKERHWNDFSLQSLRHQRIRELKYFYRFTDEEVRLYTGLTSVGSKKTTPYTLDRYDYVNPSDEVFKEELIYAAQSYYEKLNRYR